MENLSELEKDILCDKVYILTNSLTDNELEYVCYLVNFWLEERKRQNLEIEKLESEVK